MVAHEQREPPARRTRHPDVQVDRPARVGAAVQPLRPGLAGQAARVVGPLPRPPREAGRRPAGRPARRPRRACGTASIRSMTSLAGRPGTAVEPMCVDLGVRPAPSACRIRAISRAACAGQVGSGSAMRSPGSAGAPTRSRRCSSNGRSRSRHSGRPGRAAASQARRCCRSTTSPRPGAGRRRPARRSGAAASSSVIPRVSTEPPQPQLALGRRPRAPGGTSAASPVSTSSGTSLTTIASGRAPAAVSSAVRARTRGWMIRSSRRRAASSPKTLAPSAGRSSSPSGVSTPGAERLDDLGQAVGAGRHDLAGQPVGVDDHRAALRPAARRPRSCPPRSRRSAPPSARPSHAAARPGTATSVAGRTAGGKRPPGEPPADTAEGRAAYRSSRRQAGVPEPGRRPLDGAADVVSSCRRRASRAGRRGPRRWPGCRPAPRRRAPGPASSTRWPRRSTTRRSRRRPEPG